MNLRTSLTLLPAFLGAAIISSCATAPQVDPAAHTVLMRTTEKLRSARTIEVTGTRQADPALLPVGSTRELVKFDLSVKRPGSLVSKSSDGEGVRHLMAGDGSITLYDENSNSYTTAETDATTIDGLVDEIESKFDTKMAVGELLGADPMAFLMDEVTSVKTGGDEQVGRTLCTRLDFTQKDMNWQLWVAKSDALPRKISMTYTKKAGQPKHVVTINQWKLNASMPASLFTFTPKKGAEEVEIIH